MAFKVNYGLERAERNRAKQAKKDAKAAAKKANGGVDPEESDLPPDATTEAEESPKQ
jgi:hypothetical protein